MTIYKNYTNALRNLISNTSNLGEVKMSNFSGETRQSIQLSLVEDLKEELGLREFNSEPLGLHPDYSHLKGTENFEKGYIISMFVDIKGSTILYDKYSNLVISQITQIIQSAAIHTFYCFGGYIQRLEGDGVFVYFGRKGMDKKWAIKQSLLSASLYAYFIKNDLNEILGLKDKKIRIRIGIDFGDQNEVVWRDFGIGIASEITTTSLHTSLAAKMLKWANPNGIMVGKNIVQLSELPEYLFSIPKDSYGAEKRRYIYQGERLLYSQHEFDWLSYLKNQPFISVNEHDHLSVASKGINDQLYRKAISLNSGIGLIKPDGRVGRESGVKVQPHRFHYGKK